jgi:hypothetical protein
MGVHIGYASSKYLEANIEVFSEIQAIIQKSKVNPDKSK